VPKIPHLDDIADLLSILKLLGEGWKFEDLLEGILANLDNFVAFLDVF